MGNSVAAGSGGHGPLTLKTQTTRSMRAEIKSAKNSGHYLILFITVMYLGINNVKLTHRGEK